MDVKLVKPTEGYSVPKPQLERNGQADTIVDEQSKAAINPNQKWLSKDLDINELDTLSQQLSKFMSEMGAGIQFTVHEKTNSLMVQVVDTTSQKVLKEFPSKEFLDTIANIREYVGFLLDKRA